jgi:hypothetical protein
MEVGMQACSEVISYWENFLEVQNFTFVWLSWKGQDSQRNYVFQEHMMRPPGHYLVQIFIQCMLTIISCSAAANMGGAGVRAPKGGGRFILFIKCKTWFGKGRQWHHPPHMKPLYKWRIQTHACSACDNIRRAVTYLSITVGQLRMVTSLGTRQPNWWFTRNDSVDWEQA